MSKVLTSFDNFLDATEDLVNEMAAEIEKLTKENSLLRQKLVEETRRAIMAERIISNAKINIIAFEDIFKQNL